MSRWCFGSPIHLGIGFLLIVILNFDLRSEAWALGPWSLTNAGFAAGPEPRSPGEGSLGYRTRHWCLADDPQPYMLTPECQP